MMILQDVRRALLAYLHFYHGKPCIWEAMRFSMSAVLDVYNVRSLRLYPMRM